MVFYKKNRQVFHPQTDKQNDRKEVLMSVTVADILELPSLRQAKVIAGAGGITKIVSSISVLETADPSYLVDDLFQKGEFFGSEIVITGFLNNVDDYDAQLATIQRLAEGGEIGLILFYVGVYIPKVDKRIINFANENDFIIIQMPPLKSLRYGEVISDVSEYIFNDRTKNQFIVSDILARVSRLPEHQQTINTVLRMVSDEVKASLILTDADLHTLNLTVWPQGVRSEISEHLHEIYHYDNYHPDSYSFLSDFHIYSVPIHTDYEQPMQLFIVKETSPLNQVTRSQIADIIRISANIWGKGHNKVAIHELVRAILQDDPIKMKRLADIFQINTAKIHEMWFFATRDKQAADLLKEKKEVLCEHLKSCTGTVFADFYQNDLLIFTSTLDSEKEAEKQAAELLDAVLKENNNITLSRFNNLANTSDVRNAYLRNKEYISDAIKIFPNRRWFSAGDIEFAQECHQLIDSGEKNILPYRLLHNQLAHCRSDWDATKTLGIYMLDAQCSITKTAALLHVHINTVKYRLKVIDDFLGYSHSKMPDNMKLYYALALERLLE